MDQDLPEVRLPIDPEISITDNSWRIDKDCDSYSYQTPNHEPTMTQPPNSAPTVETTGAVPPTPSGQQAPPNNYLTCDNFIPENVVVGDIADKPIPDDPTNKYCKFGIKYNHQGKKRTLGYETPELVFPKGLKDMRNEAQIATQKANGVYMPKFVMTAALDLKKPEDAAFCEKHTKLYMAYRALFYNHRFEAGHPKFTVEPPPTCPFTNFVYTIEDERGEEVKDAPRLFKLKVNHYYDREKGTVDRTEFKLPDGTIIEDWTILQNMGFKAVVKIFYHYIYASKSHIRVQIKTNSCVVTELFEKPSQIQQKDTMERIQQTDPEAVNRILAQMAAYNAQKTGMLALPSTEGVAVTMDDSALGALGEQPTQQPSTAVSQAAPVQIPAAVPQAQAPLPVQAQTPAPVQSVPQVQGPPVLQVNEPSVDAFMNGAATYVPPTATTYAAPAIPGVTQTTYQPGQAFTPVQQPAMVLQ